jgi:hypothetical protein
LGALITNTPEYGSPTFLFGSDLKRTRQTMIHIIKAFPALPEESMGTGEQIIVLPCAHELTYNTSKGKCDVSQGVPPNENISTCTRDACYTDGIVKGQKYINDWNSYYDFYSGATRTTRKWRMPCLTCAKEPVGKRCRDTDMIAEAIEIVKIEYERRNDTSTRTSRATSYSRQSMGSLSDHDFFDDELDDESDDETTRDTLVTNPVRSEYLKQSQLLGGHGRKTRSRRDRRVIKTRRGRKTRPHRARHAIKTRRGRKTHKTPNTHRARDNKTRRKRRKQ